MKYFPVRLSIAALGCLSVFALTAWSGSAIAAGRGHSDADVLTYHNDAGRTGQNRSEKQLTPTTVASVSFGKLTTFSVDGQVYAQPLYVHGVKVDGHGKCNVLIVCTEHDSVYAFDADAAPGAAPLWKHSFLDPSKNVAPVPSDEVGSGSDLTPEIGITGTPVIDKKRGTLYVVAKTKEGIGQDDSGYFQRLHALDISSGQERKDGVATIAATVSGKGDGSDHGIIHFSARRQNQRAGLLLLDGVVYVAWASHADHGPYQGWMMAFDAKSLKMQSVWNSAPNGGLSGIWMSAAGIAADDSGSIYFSTGNGSADPTVNSYGDSFVRMLLDKKTGLQLTDFFMPYNHEELNAQDADLCSSVLLIPDDDATNRRKLMIGGGKQGWLYLMDRDNMGHVNPTHDNVVQRFNPGGSSFDALAYYRDTIYYAGAGSALRAFRVENGKVRETPMTETAIHFGFPGTSPSVSSNDDRDAIVWAIENGVPGALHAYYATDLRRELFSSRTLPRDDMGAAIKFTVPTVADGKVFIGGADRVTVYGLLPTGATQAVTAATIDTVAATAGPVIGLVGRWAFDEGSGTQARDSSIGSNGNSDANGDVQGEVTRIAGVVGSGALDLHGVGNAISRVVIPDRPRFHVGANDSFTLALWVNPSPAAPADRAMTVLSRANPASIAATTPPTLWALLALPNHQWEFGSLSAASGTFTFADPLQGGDARPGWHHLAVVQDGASHKRRLYVDGKEVASGAAARLDQAGDLWLGGAANTAKSSLVGGIDDFRLYGRALERDEISALIGVGKR